MTKSELVKFVRNRCFLLGSPVSDWSDNEVLNLAKTWGLSPKL